MFFWLNLIYFFNYFIYDYAIEFCIEKKFSENMENLLFKIDDIYFEDEKSITGILMIKRNLNDSFKYIAFKKSHQRDFYSFFDVGRKACTDLGYDSFFHNAFTLINFKSISHISIYCSGGAWTGFTFICE